MKRKISQKFINDLQDGTLTKILDYIIHDNTLDLHIRNNYINIYYRGGNILKVTERKNSFYKFEYDSKYLKDTRCVSKDTLDMFLQIPNWNNYFPFMKQAMDFYFANSPKDEREYQQLVVRENNYSRIANGTDYFIIDIEYDNHANARFDLIAIEWPSDGSIRKLSKNFTPKLVAIEMKYGDKALKNDSGIQKHIDDFEKFVSGTKELEEFKNEMIEVFRQKRQLGLISSISHNNNEVVNFANNVEMIFLVANHDPASKVLKEQLCNLNPETKFVSSNFMGYGLYVENVLPLSDFNNRFENQI